MNYFKVVIAALVLLACKPQGSSFSGSQNKQRGDEANLQKRSSTEPLKPACGANGVTKVKLLSDYLASGQPGNHLIYAISAVDCDGKNLEKRIGHIDFDIGAYSTIIDGLNYKVGSSDESRDLKRVPGRDLFGNSGETFQFYRTDEVVELGADSKEIRIRIELGGAELEPYTEKDIANGTIATYLRFGDAEPVEQSVPLH